MRKLVLLLIAVVLAASVVSFGCGDGDKEPNGNGGSETTVANTPGTSAEKLNVVTTVAPLTNIVKNVGGDCIELEGIIPDGVDSHTFEPSPANARQLADGDIFIMNGAHLEGTSEEIAQENLSDPAKIYKLADNTLSGEDEKTGYLYDFSFPREAGDPNPHLWMNPLYAKHYAELTAQWLGENDAARKAYYDANYEAYAAVLDQLDSTTRVAVATVPEEQRRLLTYHDSWAYWAREYGWTVIGAIQPSDFAEPSAQDVAGLIDQIKEENVAAVFGSEVYPSPVTEQIARETGATYVNELSDDEPPGEVGAPEHTYVGMVVYDMRAMLPALGGSAGAFADVLIENSYTEGCPA